MRCPHCNATNPADARWCNQCLAPLVEPAATAPASPRPPAEQRPPTPAGPTVEPAPGGEEWEHPEGFRRTGELIERRCARCDAYYDVALGRCPVCGSDAGIAAGTGALAGEGAAPAGHAWPAVLALSAVLPGAGHLAINRYGAGLSRAILAGLWLIGAVLLFGAGGAAALLGAAPLLLGVGVLWAASLLELLALSRGLERQVLSGRTLLWLVVGVTLATAGGMAVAAIGALRG